MRPITAFLAITLLATHCFAWSGKEHVQLTRLAAMRLIADPQTPPAMKDWLRDITPGLTDEAGEREFLMTARVQAKLENSGGGVLYWAMEPDERRARDGRNAKRPPFDQPERLMHFIDLELFLTGERKRGYQEDFSGLPPIENIPRDPKDERFVQAGYLPFALEHAYQQLVKAIRENRLKPAEGVGDLEDDSAMRWAGYLAHYAQDNTQPHHSTLDYRSQSYFKFRRGAPDVHAEIEYRLIDDKDRDFRELREKYWDIFAVELRDGVDPITTNDVWRASLEVSYKSYRALPLIGRAAVAAAVRPTDGQPEFIDTEKFFAHRETIDGEEISVMQLKARQTAWAVKRTQAMWLAAWNEARP